MNLSIIIAYRPDGGIRDQHLKWTVARYKRLFPKAEIIISKDAGLGWDTFRKSKMINLGVKKASNENLLITDIDVIFTFETIIKGLSLIRDHCMIIPMNELWSINRKETNNILKRKPTIKMPIIDSQNCKKKKRIGYRPNGWHIMTKENFYKAGGYDERFIGWGSEDSCFIKAAVTLCDKPFLRQESIAYHLWHPTDNKRHQKRGAKSGILIKEYKDAFMDKMKMEAILQNRRAKQ